MIPGRRKREDRAQGLSIEKHSMAEERGWGPVTNMRLGTGVAGL